MRNNDLASPDDQRFDAMLRRELKADASPARSDCPGAEQLAALWERSLSRSERALVESHIAGCARCQSAMAAMARAQSNGTAAHAPGLWFRLAAPAAVLAVVVAIIGINLFGAPLHGRREQIAMALRHRMLRHHRKSPPVFTPAPPPSETGAATKPQRSQPEVVAQAEKRLRENPPPVAPAAKESESAPARELAMTESPRAAEPERAQAPNAAAPRPAMNRAEVPPSNPESAPQPITPPQAAAPAVAAGSAAPSTPGESMAGAAPAEPGTGAGNAMNVPATPAQPGSGGASIGAAGGAIQAPSGQAPAIQMMAPSSPTTMAKTLPGPVASVPRGLRPGFTSFQSPPPDVVAWNIGPGGLIQRLRKDGWETLHSGTRVDLLYGSAPSAQVCWVAGKDGTLLRTIDGGDHWEPITAPAAVELVKIEAGSADSATVTTADGRRFSTADGGQDWSEE